jgi:predicted nuclease of predicted toxin-antitoxin system
LTSPKLILPLFLDEGAPRSVGVFLSENGHNVTYMQDAMARGSPDLLVSEVALRNNAILVAVDPDMRRIASRHGIGSSRFKRLHLLQFLCAEPQAVHRLREALSLIEHEWELCQRKAARRFWVEIGNSFIRTHR